MSSPSACSTILYVVSRKGGRDIVISTNIPALETQYDASRQARHALQHVKLISHQVRVLAGPPSLIIHRLMALRAGD
jgi:hypothetical protein